MQINLVLNLNKTRTYQNKTVCTTMFSEVKFQKNSTNTLELLNWFLKLPKKLIFSLT